MENMVLHNSGLNRSDWYRHQYRQEQANGNYDLADIYFSLVLYWREVEKKNEEEK